MKKNLYLLKNSREMRRGESARPRGMRDAKYGRKILRPSCIPKGGACHPLLKSYKNLFEFADESKSRELWSLEKRCFQTEDVFSLRRVRYLLSCKNGITLIVSLDGVIVAYIIGLMRFFRIPSGRVYKIGVAKEARSKGFASMLLMEMENLFREKGMERVCAEARRGNSESILLFEKHKYEPGNILAGYYPDGEDAIKFWKDL